MKVQRQIPVTAYRAAGFMDRYQRLIRSVVIPYQHDILWDRIPGVEKSHAAANFISAGRVLRGEDPGDGFYGMVFQDSDAAKWIEAAAYTLVWKPDPKLEQNIDETIDLIAAAQHLGPEYQILIVGSGPLRENLEEEIRVYGVSEKVKLLGYVEDEEMHALLGASDVFVLSSVMKTEAFGIVQIEAMSLGKPVIATKVPESGVSWVNADGESGLNVPIKDPEAIAEAIRRICSDADLYGQLSEGAAARFRNLFTLDRMIEKTIKIYTNDEKSD